MMPSTTSSTVNEVYIFVKREKKILYYFKRDSSWKFIRF